MTDTPPQRREASPWPSELRVLRGERALEIAFDDGTRHRIPAELLRVESPSAEVQGHVPSQKQTPAGKASVGIEKVEPVGHYAVRITFSDGHDTGIFTWPYLLELGRDQDRLLAAYRERLSALGLSRGA